MTLTELKCANTDVAQASMLRGKPTFMCTLAKRNAKLHECDTGSLFNRK